jgi:RNA polymerase sigma-70 factor (ECF subfamily)
VDDRQLAAACASGDEGAWLELIRRHDRKVLHVLWQMGVREELDDLRQEVWVRLLSAMRGFRADHPGALRVFLGTVARSVAIDHGRALRPSGEMPVLVDPAPGPDAGVDRPRLLAALEKAAAETENPARDRDILRLHFEEGHTPGEIADMGLGLNVRGVESVLRRARERLKALLVQE